MNAFSPLREAHHYFDLAADRLGLSTGLRALLRYPLREFHFRIPVRMDDGSTRVFRGVRVQHNDARGPAMGGLRFHPLDSLDSLRAMAMWMTWKCALVELPLGGAQGGIACDPRDLSPAEQERLCRALARVLTRQAGPHRDVAAPDLMADARHLLWFADEFEALRGVASPGVATGKPVGVGGSLGRQEATGYGVVFCLREALARHGLKPADASASFQGFGRVARAAAGLLAHIGVRVVSVACWDPSARTVRTYRRRGGLEIESLVRLADRFGGIDRETAGGLGCEVLPGDAWLEQPVDILVPAALEYQITGENVSRISESVRILAEGANSPVSPEAESILIRRGVRLIPDILCNAGGAIADYFELVQNDINFYWTRDEVLGKLDVRMTAAYRDLDARTDRWQISSRAAACAVAVERVARACLERGWG